jgi:hypothetical protein
VRPPNQLRLALFSIGIGLLAAIAVLITKYGVRSLPRAPAWAAAAAKLKLSLDQDASAGAFYDRTGTGPLPLAAVVKEFREAWPKENISLIHTAALEVGTALLHRSDIEVGELVGGKFVPSPDAPWQTNEQMRAHLKDASAPFENDQLYVFRRK